MSVNETSKSMMKHINLQLTFTMKFSGTLNIILINIVRIRYEGKMYTKIN